MNKIEECWVIQRDDGSFFARTEYQKMIMRMFW